MASSQHNAFFRSIISQNKLQNYAAQHQVIKFDMKAHKIREIFQELIKINSKYLSTSRHTPYLQIYSKIPHTAAGSSIPYLQRSH